MGSDWPDSAPRGRLLTERRRQRRLVFWLAMLWIAVLCTIAAGLPTPTWADAFAVAGTALAFVTVVLFLLVKVAQSLDL